MCLGVGGEFQAEGTAGEMALRSQVPRTLGKDKAEGAERKTPHSTSEAEDLGFHSQERGITLACFKKRNIVWPTPSHHSPLCLNVVYQKRKVKKD